MRSCKERSPARKKWEAVIPATSEIGLLNLIKRPSEERRIK